MSYADDVYESPRPRVTRSLRIDEVRGRFERMSTACANPDARTLLLRTVVKIDSLETTPAGVIIHRSDGRRVEPTRPLAEGAAFFDYPLASFYFSIDGNRVTVGVIDRASKCGVRWTAPVEAL